MNIKTKEILPDIRLSCLKTSKFKSGSLTMNLLCPLRRETASMNAILPKVLRRGTLSLPNMELISRKLDSLYGASLGAYVQKKGEIHIITFSSSFADDCFIPEESQNLGDMIGLMSEMLISPATHGGLLNHDYVESEKEKLLQKIRGRINDKRSYSVLRLKELMCSMEEYGVSSFGTEDSVENINYKALTQYYHRLISNVPIEIFYCGSADFSEVAEKLKIALAPLPRNDEYDDEFDINVQIRMNALEEKPRYFEDKMDVTQGKLALGYRLGDCMYDPDLPAIEMFNAIFGGGINSKLFANVREKLSLCYFASSSLDLCKGTMVVSSGIEFDKYDEALAEINIQLENVKKGDITEEEFLYAKRYLVSAYKTCEDSPSALSGFYLDRALIGPDCSPSEYVLMLEEVKLADVVEIANGVECDAIYFLRGQEEEN